ncbi:hypothetical protein C0992_012953, partial [Termitomyces sp. T32_za158]
MHNLFLGLIKEHFRNILGYDHEGKTKKGQERGVSMKGLIVNIRYTADNPRPEKTSHAKDVRALVKWLSQQFLESDEQDAVKKWSKISLPALKCVAQGLDGCEIHPRPKKCTREYYAQAIVTWRSKQTADDEIWEPGTVFTDDEKKAIADDRDYITKPSWMPSVPITSGSKLKADEWRTLG